MRVSAIRATTGGLPLQRMKQPCLKKGSRGWDRSILKVPLLKEPIGVNLTSNPVRECCLTIKARSPLAPLKKGSRGWDRKPL
jgi:hypothetical protein